VHQQGTPGPGHAPPGEATLLQFPAEHDHLLAAEGTSAQSAASYLPAAVGPVHVPVHRLLALEHWPLEQSVSAAQRHAVCAAFTTGVGDSVVVHEYAVPVGPARPPRVVTYP
jgi:hypothetical protein